MTRIHYLIITIAVVVLDAVSPFDPCGAVAEAGDHHRILERDRALVIIAVQRPGPDLHAVQPALLQADLERMLVVVALRADGASIYRNVDASLETSGNASLEPPAEENP